MQTSHFHPLFACAAAALLSLSSTAFAQDKIDWPRARELRQKEVRGERLSDQEQAYLEKAKEARAVRRQGRAGTDAGIRGDGAGKQQFIAPVSISAKEAPFGELHPKTSDGENALAVYRRPARQELAPVVVFIHGGLKQKSKKDLRLQLRRNPVYTRMLASGHVVVASTFRTYSHDVQSRGPILDSLAVVEAVKQLPFVDPESVVVFGGSGGGSIALELASEADLAAVVCGEPATILYTGMLTTGDYQPRLKIMDDPHAYFTEEINKRTLKKLKTIRCPVLILHGDVHPLKVMNGEIMLPAMRQAGVDVEYKIYPGQVHGFYTGNRANKEVVEQVVNDVREFIEPNLSLQPKPLSEQ